MSPATTALLQLEHTVQDTHYTQQEIDAMDTQELLMLYKHTGDETLKWPLVLRYEKLVKNVALQIRSVYSSFAQVDDIVDEGILTLLSAIDKYDPSKGVKFETYVAKRIRGMVVDLARKQDWLPRNIRQHAKEIDRAISALSNSLGRFPSDEEVAQYLGISTERYQKYAAGVSLSNVLSLDALIDAKSFDSCQRDFLEEHCGEQPEAAAQEKELHAALAEGIRQLRKNEQIVISLCYEQNLPMKEIAQVMGVSGPRVSQIHAKALQKLRLYMESYMNGKKPTKAKKGKKEARNAQRVLQSDIWDADPTAESERGGQQSDEYLDGGL